MAGALYIWIMGAIFLAVIGAMGLIIAVLWAGHWLEKRETGSKTKFLELPEGAGSRPVSTADLPPKAGSAGVPQTPEK